MKRFTFIFAFLILCLPMTVNAREDCADTGEHVWGDWHVEEEATCCEVGLKCRICEICGVWDSIEIPTTSHTWGKWIIDEAATYSSKGYKYRYCKVCDEEQEATIPIKTPTAKQKKVIKAVETYMNAVKKYDTKKMSKCFLKPSEAKKQWFALNFLTKAAKKYNKNITYDIKKVTVKGKKATVKVEVKTGCLLEVFIRSYDDLIDYCIKYPNASVNTASKYYTNRWKYYIKNKPKLIYNSTRTVTFTYVKSNGKWKIKKPTTGITDIANLRFTWSANQLD